MGGPTNPWGQRTGTPAPAPPASKPAAKPGHVKATVTSEGDAKPVKSATVKLSGPAAANGSTNAAGVAEFPNLKAGAYTLDVSAKDFKAAKAKATVQEDKTTAVAVTLQGTGPAPTIKAKWAKQEVEPVHNKNFRPKTPPTDEIPDESKAEMVVDTTDVPDGTSAAIQVYQCEYNYPVFGGTFTGLQVKGNQVVDPATGKRPFMMFTLDDAIYIPWNKDLYYFVATVDYRSLEGATEKDATKNEAACLRVAWYHVCAADAIADKNDGLTTQAEMREIAGIIGKQKHHKVGKHAFNAAHVGTSIWGSWLRNTYCYHHASHGDLIHRKTGVQCPDNHNPPIVSPKIWRSVILIGESYLGEPQVADEAKVPSTPRYLVYFNTCLAGWEPDFAHAIIKRGTQNVIAFRMSIPDGPARAMSRKFHKKWIGTHNGDPGKINEVFFDVGSPYYWKMRPVLFGLAGGPILKTGHKANVAKGQALEAAGGSW